MPNAAALKAATVTSISDTEIKLSNGEIFNIPYSDDDSYSTIVLTRHAERISKENDSKLTKEGETRAQNLKNILLPMTPDRIYTSSYTRCVLTTLPLARAMAKPNVHYDVSDSKALLNTILNEHKTSKAVIIGHSNTIPEMLNLLSGSDKYQTFDDNEYSKLFLVQTKGLGDSKIMELTY